MNKIDNIDGTPVVRSVVDNGKILKVQVIDDVLYLPMVYTDTNGYATAYLAVDKEILDQLRG